MVALAEVAEISGGITKNAKRSALPIQRPYLSVANVHFNRIDTNNLSNIGVNEAEIARAQLMPGDLMVVEGNGSLSQLGRVAIWNGQVSGCLHQNHLIKVRPKPTVKSKWLLYWLMSSAGREAIEATASSTSGLHTLSLAKVGSLPAPIASLEEQEAAIAYIDLHLSRLDETVTTLLGIQAKLKQARASILKAAVEGRLIPSDADLDRLIEDQVQTTAVMTPKDSDSEKANRYGTLPRVPSGWSASKISDLTSLVTSGSRGWSRFYSDEGAIFVRSQDINTYKLELAGVAKVSLPGSIEGSRTQIKQGDLLLIITGANVTVSAWVERDLGEAYVSQHVALCRPREQITSAYLHIWLMAPGAGKFQLDSSAYGAGKPGLNLENIRSITVFVPSLPEQYRIVAEVDRRFSVLDQVEATVTASLVRCGKLRQAILKRAFGGCG